MKIDFFCPHWGSESVAFIDFADNVKASGYQGVEMSLPFDNNDKKYILNCLKKYELGLIAQHWETINPDFKAHRIEYESRLLNLAHSNPLFINSQTGKDYFTFEQNAELIALADSISMQTGIKIVHETHRGKFSFAAHITKHYLEALPELQITFDVSHWCNVAESFLADQREAVNLAISRTHHVHARVGYEEGPQVPDPSDGLWENALNIHLGWWKQIKEIKNNNFCEAMTITPEFGSPPYMILKPFSHHPICDQWAANVFMMNYLKKTLNHWG